MSVPRIETRTPGKVSLVSDSNTTPETNVAEEPGMPLDQSGENENKKKKIITYFMIQMNQTHDTCI